MASNFPEGWQARHVAIIGPDTRSIMKLGPTAPLKVWGENRPIGTVLTSHEGTTAVTGPYALVEWGFPADIAGVFTWSGKLKLVRKAAAFPRDVDEPAVATATLLLTKDYTGDPLWPMTREAYADASRLLDQGLTPGNLWYYTVLYENSIDGKYTFSPAYGHARAFAFQNEDDASGTMVSYHGDWLFSQVPRMLQLMDSRDGGDSLRKMCRILGRSLDKAKEAAEQYRATAYDPSTVDSALLPYIDWLLGWSTNFELSEEKRRKETSNIASVWKARGTSSALETAIQTVTGWDTTVYTGWQWVVTAPAEPILDPAVAPAGWNAGTDGVWADLVNALPIQGAPDATNPAVGLGTGTLGDIKVYTPTSELPGPGTWQNPYGVLIAITEVAGISGILYGTVINKVVRLIPLFLSHYAGWAIQVEPLPVEEIWGPLGLGDDSYSDVITAVNPEGWQPFLLNGAWDYWPKQFINMTPSASGSAMPDTPDHVDQASNPYFVTPHNLVRDCWNRTYTEMAAMLETRLEADAFFWLQGDDIVPAAGSDLGTAGSWPPRVGTDEPLQATPAKRPVVSATTLNGIKLAEFNLANSECLRVDRVDPSAESGAIFAALVKQTDPLAADSAVLELGEPSFDSVEGGVLVDFKTGTLYVGIYGDSLVVTDKVTVENYSDGWRMILIRVDFGLPAADEIEVRINGIEPEYAAENNNDNGNLMALLPLNIGSRNQGSFFFDGLMAEVYIGKMDVELWELLSSYWTTKYALTPP